MQHLVVTVSLLALRAAQMQYHYYWVPHSLLDSDDDVWDETTWEDSEDKFTETTEPEGDITEDSDQEDGVWEDY